MSQLDLIIRFCVKFSKENGFKIAYFQTTFSNKAKIINYVYIYIHGCLGKASIKKIISCRHAPPLYCKTCEIIGVFPRAGEPANFLAAPAPAFFSSGSGSGS